MLLHLLCTFMADYRVNFTYTVTNSHSLQLFPFAAASHVYVSVRNVVGWISGHQATGERSDRWGQLQGWWRFVRPDDRWWWRRWHRLGRGHEEMGKSIEDRAEVINTSSSKVALQVEEKYQVLPNHFILLHILQQSWNVGLISYLSFLTCFFIA